MNARKLTKTSKYYFDIYDDLALIADTAGRRFDSPATAIIEARSVLFEVGSCMSSNGTDAERFMTIVRDETGRRFFQARLIYGSEKIN